MKTLHVEYDRDGVLLNAWREIDGEWAMTFQTRQGAMRAINSKSIADVQVGRWDGQTSARLAGYESCTTGGAYLSLIHISEPTRPCGTSRMPSSA